MNAPVTFTTQGPLGTVRRKSRQPDPSPPNAIQPGLFPLRRLAAVSGVDAATIEMWTSRHIFDRPTANDGKHRRFDFWDCLHVAIIAEMRTLGLQLSGRGAVLCESLLAIAKAHVAQDRDLNFVPDRIALYARDDKAEWAMDWETSPDRLPRSDVVLNLRAIVEDISRRYHAALA